MTFTVPEVWSFERSDVAGAFDQHVREQLPWYDLVTSAVAQIARHYINPGGRVYDIGASTGNVGLALLPTLTQRGASLVALEQAEAMVDKYAGPGQVIHTPAEIHEFQPCDLAVSMLALMFLRPADVPVVIDRVLASLNPGGAFVIVERTLPPHGYPSIVTSRLTLAAKAAMGASGADIVAKELSLAGVQRPLATTLLATYGAVEWFRFGDFAGYLIEAAQ